MIVLAKDRTEPRTTIGSTGMKTPPVLGTDAKGLFPGVAGVVDETAEIFPNELTMRANRFAQSFVMKGERNLHRTENDDQPAHDRAFDRRRMRPGEHSDVPADQLRRRSVRSQLLIPRGAQELLVGRALVETADEEHRRRTCEPGDSTLRVAEEAA